MIDDRSGLRMDIPAAPVRFQHLFIPTVERPDPEFHLGIVQLHHCTPRGCNEQPPDAHRVAALPGHVLQVRVPGGEPPRLRPQRHQIRVDAPRCLIHMAQIPVQISAPYLPNPPVFLHHLKEPCKLRAVLPAPVRQQDHGLVIRRFLVFRRGLKYRQPKVFVKIIFERRSRGIRPDLHVPDQESDLLPDLHDPPIGLPLPLLHGRLIQHQPVIAHDPAEYGGGALHLLHQKPVPRQIPVKPVIEQIIEPQGIVAVGAGIAHRLPILRG